VEHRERYLRLALIVPVILHGIYDFILMTQRYYMLSVFVVYIAYLWKRGMSNVRELVECSPYKELEDSEDD